MKNTQNLTKRPYISFVTTSRNDGHGGSMEERFQISLDSLLTQLDKYHIESELIVVDYNPPPDRPLLKEIIMWPSSHKYCTIRNIVVPNSVHRRYKYADKVLLGAGAVNCGIRRARGEYVLPRNSDLIYSNELILYIADKNLKSDKRYRVDRCDVDRRVMQCASFEERMEFCKDNIIRVHAKDTVPEKFGLFSKKTLPVLHTNASGDFQLMSRENWYKLRGYRELQDDIISQYADGLLCFASYAAGIREVVLENPMCLYHIDHDGKFADRKKGSGLPFENLLAPSFLPEGIRRLVTRLYRIMLTAAGYRLKGSENGVPTLHFTEYRRMAREIVSGKRSFVFNDENWGLGQDDLKEYIINIAEWDTAYGRN